MHSTHEYYQDIECLQRHETHPSVRCVDYYEIMGHDSWNAVNMRIDILYTDRFFSLSG